MPQKTKSPSPTLLAQNDEELVIKKFKRKPFPVDGTQVSPGNIHKVAEWCGGSVETERKVVDDHGTIMEQKYIFVETHQPMNDRQKMAFIGDHVLKSDKGFKVYSDRAFKNAFVVDENIVTDRSEHSEGPSH